MKQILFNTDMVRGLQANRKTATRRVMKPQPVDIIRNVKAFRADKGPVTLAEYKDYRIEQLVFPYLPGDILYVRETWRKDVARYMYKADYSDNEKFYRNGKEISIKWRPSIHMPREAARIFLRVTAVRVERLQDMTDEDLVRDFDFCREAIQAVGRDALAKPFWDSTINPSGRKIFGWDANPWVWVIEFERVSREEAMQHG